MVAAIGLVASPCWSGLEDLARSGDWERVLEIAARRADQLPLSPAESMIAATAARALADPEAERHYLEIATGAASEELRRLAEVRLAELVGADEPDRAVSLALPAFGRENPWQLRTVATEVSQLSGQCRNRACTTGRAREFAAEAVSKPTT